MDSIHYSLSSNAYKNNIFTGFSQLQKQEEFVDLTLAADGCIVKVHRNLIALASPYLREILRSMSNHSPVIYLNNVSQTVLSYLLEFIYQGEVNIPADAVDAFIEVSKSLHIAGIEDLEPPNQVKLSRKLTAKRRKPPERRAGNNTADIVMNSGSVDLSTAGVMEVQQNVQNNDLENNYNYETDHSMHDQQQTVEIINNAKFIVQQNQESSNNEMLHNVALIEMETESNQLNIHTNMKNAKYIDPNLLQSQTVTPEKGNQNTDTNQNIPVIEIISETANQLQTNTSQLQTDYKIIVKTQNNQADRIGALQNNIPVIEIQHLGSTVQQVQNTTSEEYMLATQADILAQAFHDNPIIPIETGMKLNQINQAKERPIIKVLDDIIIKPGVCLSENNVDNGQIASGGTEVTGALPADCKVNMNDMKNMTQFSVTERGALQLILNRYLYCCHHSTRVKQRWRCIDYRRKKCLAVVDTIDGAIVARKELHAHPFHDKKIFDKHKKGLIYQNARLALLARDAAQNEGLKKVSIDETDEDDIIQHHATWTN